MDKNTFLEDLRKYLHVLKDEEIEDIIGEYEQHIDLKVQNGLTVEQAIADFGNVKELASEILEGYHVKAEFGVPIDIEDEKNAGTQTDRRPVKDFIKMILNWLRLIWGCLLNGIRWGGKQLVSPFLWLKRKWKSKPEHQESISPQKDSIRLKEWFIQKMKGMGAMLLKLWNWMVGMSLWCIRICWNCCVVGTALTIGGFGLLFLFTAGVLVVLLIQGYPFVGLTIGCVGLVLCLFAVTVLVWTIIWHKPKAAIEETAEEEPVILENIGLEEGQHA